MISYEVYVFRTGRKIPSPPEVMNVKAANIDNLRKSLIAKKIDGDMEVYIGNRLIGILITYSDAVSSYYGKYQWKNNKKNSYPVDPKTGKTITWYHRGRADNYSVREKGFNGSMMYEQYDLDHLLNILNRKGARDKAVYIVSKMTDIKRDANNEIRLYTSKPIGTLHTNLAGGTWRPIRKAATKRRV